MMTSSHTEEGNFRTYVEQLPYLTKKKKIKITTSRAKKIREKRSELIPPFSVLRRDFRLILIFL